MADTETRRRRGRLPTGVTRHGLGYRAEIMVDGVRQKSRTVHTVKEAERLREQMRRWRPGLEVFTLGTALDLLRQDLKLKGASAGTLRFYESEFSVLLDAWDESTPLVRIDARSIERFAEIRRDAHGVKPSTVAKNLGTLRRIFRLAVRKRRKTGIVENPIDEVGMPRFRSKRFPHLTPEQIRSILSRIQASRYAHAKHDADVIALAFLTGLRRSEIARLSVADVDLFKCSLLVRGKCGDVTIPLEDEACAVASRLVALADENTGYLIGGESEPRRAARVSAVFSRWQDRLGIRELRCHGLRHSFCTTLVRAGVPFPDAQRAARHQTPAMTMRYYHESGAAVRAAFGAVTLQGTGDHGDRASQHG